MKQSYRGKRATDDMKRRIAALRNEDADIISILWERYRNAVLDRGFTYEYASSERAVGRNRITLG